MSYEFIQFPLNVDVLDHSLSALITLRHPQKRWFFSICSPVLPPQVIYLINFSMMENTERQSGSATGQLGTISSRACPLSIPSGASSIYGKPEISQLI